MEQVHCNHINLGKVNKRIIYGIHNVMEAHDCTIVGDHNKITGDNNTVEGDHNSIEGDNNKIEGNHNKTNGKDNKMIGNFNRCSTTQLSNTGLGSLTSWEGVEAVFRDWSPGSTNAKYNIITTRSHTATGKNISANVLVNVKGPVVDGNKKRSVFEEKEKKIRKVFQGSQIKGEITYVEGDQINIANKPAPKKAVFFLDQKVIEGQDRKLEKDEEKGACKVCFENKIQTVNLPCGHSILCFQCARLFEEKTCYVCKQDLNTITRIISDDT